MGLTPSIDQSFDDIYHNYVYSVQGYRLFLEHLHESLETLGEGGEAAIRKHVREIIEGLDSEETRGVLGELEQFAKKLQKTIDGRKAALGEQNAAIQPEQEADETTVTPDDETGSGQSHTHGFTLDLSDPAASALVQILERTRRDRWIGVKAQRRLLYRSVITGLVGQFEVLVADIAHQFYRRAPDALDTSTPLLSVAELRQIGSVEAAFDLLVMRKTDELLTQSLDAWAAFFSSRMKIELRNLARDWSVFQEFIQRRHIIVHAGGRITSRYLDNVDDTVLETYFDEPVLGAFAELDREYVDTALDHFEQMGILFCLEAWTKLQRGSLDHMEGALQNCVYARLSQGRWQMALAIATPGIDSMRLSTSAQVVCRLNAWLCMKRLGRFDEVKADVENFDVSALENRFKIVRLALLGQADDLLDLIEKTEGRDLDRVAWYEWPVLDDFRTHPRFEALARRFAPKPKEETSTNQPDGDMTERSS